MAADFVKQIKALVADAVANIHTAMPGTIESIDTTTGTATITPAGKYKTSDGKEMDYPSIAGVPLVFPMGNSNLTGIVIPVKAGDDCLLIIAEQSLDPWLYGGESSVDLKHDLTNAIAIPGPLKKVNQKALDAATNNSVIVYSGETKLEVSQSGIAITGNLTVMGNISSTGNIKSSGGITGATGGISEGGVLTATAVQVSGEVTASSVSATGDVTAGGISLKTHTHISAAAGSATTMPS